MRRILVIDNYDSFTFNLVHTVQKVTDDPVDVYRNDQINPDDIKVYDKIILSPGPGIPDEAGFLKEIIKKNATNKSIFGVCLGLQAIAEVFGGKLINLANVFHGVSTPIKICYPEEKIFQNVPVSFEAGRYHSWIVSKEGLPDCFELTAIDDSGQIMGLSHKVFDVKGVQFHPESVLTPEGEKIISNWLSY